MECKVWDLEKWGEPIFASCGMLLFLTSQNQTCPHIHTACSITEVLIPPPLQSCHSQKGASYLMPASKPPPSVELPVTLPLWQAKTCSSCNRSGQSGQNTMAGVASLRRSSSRFVVRPYQPWSRVRRWANYAPSSNGDCSIIAQSKLSSRADRPSLVFPIGRRRMPMRCWTCSTILK